MEHFMGKVQYRQSGHTVSWSKSHTWPLVPHRTIFDSLCYNFVPDKNFFSDQGCVQARPEILGSPAFDRGHGCLRGC